MPTIQELENFKLSDAVKFHNELNPSLWDNETLQPEVRDQLLKIAQDFISYLGVKDLDVLDITISGSNAAYSYTPHSDLDLHILVDMDKLPNDEIYRELFTAKKTLYNDSHSITVHDVPVELYVQDSNQPHISLGAYSVLTDKWIHIPKKRRANFDEASTKAKFESLKDLVELAINTKDLSRVEKAIDIIKRYRQAGLDKAGEFGPENLAFKAIRKQGGIKDLYDLKNQLRSKKLSIEEATSRHDAILKIKKLQNTQGRTPAEIENTNRIIDTLAKQHNINLADITPGLKKVDPLQDKIAMAAQRKAMAKDLLNKEWQRFKQSIFAEDGVDEDYDPNGPPPGPEFKPTMPAGTVRVDVSDVYDWYKLGQHISNMKGLGKHDFGKGPPSTILSFGDEDTEHKYIQDLEKTGLSTTDIDPVDKNQPKGMKRQKTDPTFNVNETDDRKAAVLKIQKHLNKKYGANLDLDGKLGPLTLKSINKFMPRAKKGLADEPNKTTAVQGKKLKEASVFIPSEKATLNSTASQIYMCEGIHYSKDMLLEQQLYEDFMGSAKQFLGAKFNTKMASIKGQINDTINAGIIIKDVASNPELMNNVTSQIRKWISQLVKNITRTIESVGQQLNMPQLTDKLIAAWKFISQKVTEFGSSPGWKGFLGSLGIYGFVKFISDMLSNLTTLKSTIVSGALDALVNKAKDLGQTIVSNVTLPGFLGIFDNLTTVKKYFLDVLNMVKEKFSSFTVAGSPQFSKGVQLEASGYIPSYKQRKDPRFKTALTVDVRPDAIKKNAKAFNWKTSRAGIPPQARADGKIAEDLMKEWNSFLAEDQQELFPGYDEQHREKRLSNWLAKSWGVQNGKPQTFYHATTKDFDTFNTKGTGFASVLGMSYEVERHGSFFAVDPKFAEDFIEDPNTGQVKEGGRVLPVHLSIQSPIDLRDNALSRMLSDEDTVEEFKANDIDLRSIYNHFYELNRWQLFDGPEGAEFINNLQKLGFDGAIINESIPDNSNAKSGQVWVAFSPNQVKSVYNRGSFSPDDARLMRESGELEYLGNCTEDDVVDDIFGNVSEFARVVEEHGDEFTLGNLVVKYDDDQDIHYFYKNSG